MDFRGGWGVSVVMMVVGDGGGGGEGRFCIVV